MSESRVYYKAFKDPMNLEGLDVPEAMKRYLKSLGPELKTDREVLIDIAQMLTELLQIVKQSPVKQCSAGKGEQSVIPEST